MMSSRECKEKREDFVGWQRRGSSSDRLRRNEEQDGIKEFKRDDLDYLRTSKPAKISNTYNLDWNIVVNINKK